MMYEMFDSNYIYKVSMSKIKFGVIFGVVIVVLFSLSCNQQSEFNKTDWRFKDDMVYPNRKKMIKDLTINHKLVGLRYSQLIELLGQPNFHDSTSLTYTVDEDYGRDIDPIYIKNLNFIISLDSIITSFNVEELKR